MRVSNPEQGAKKLKTTGDGVHTWSEEEVGQFATRHPVPVPIWPSC
jgi:hypothetical protein